MCGFVGQLSLSPDVERRRLYHLNNALLHRGPDDSGIVIAPSKTWGLAHRRLAVVDPECGTQPMIDRERGLTLVYNGEIYDDERLRRELSAEGYVFRTRSDTEVLLALYALRGLDMFKDLRGEFSFALIDERANEAILVRDRMGLKPLFFTRFGDTLLFGSEIKALFRDERVERRIDPQGLIGAIVVADVPGETCFAGIHQVKHAHFMRVKLDTLEMTQRRYWDAIGNARTDIPADPREQTEAVKAEVNRALQLRLRADVPVGSYLSGGIDSSIISAAAACHLDEVDCFSLAFEESRRHDEFPFAQQVAARYPNIRLHRIPVTYADTIRKLPETVWHLERPFGNLHSVAKIMQSQYARDHVVCVLTGDGGDESFCGYSTFWLQNALQKVNYSLPAIRDELNSMQREAKGIGGNRFYLSGGLARRIGPDSQFMVDKLGFRPTDLARALDGELRIRGLMNPEFVAKTDQLAVERQVDWLSESMPPANEWPHMVLLQYIHLNSIVPEYIATIADRAEFAGSVEARPPLFDHVVVELAMGLPPEAKMKGDREKHILRDAFADIVPSDVVERRKQAFLAPPAPFKGVEGQALLQRYLSREAIRDAGIWNPTKIAAIAALRRVMPRNRLINLVLTIVLTAQILHDEMINQSRWWR
ncbi:Asparagine synthetase [glutamine-hydrolyzing] 3 [Planctomycetes bacterium Pan216]|uniref:asparagine synthase (glutamine-hydrolyzing) n=1 Tax=Kolteria novifilia TaxID=2527975 RepID=A0A518AZE3_9BACT|nr:Asparagine synthetase [glutamine-hydrolyzing] 3 [Planctomycetes bacterium Pan216]